MIIKQLSLFIEDKTGGLARVTEILARHGINMLGFCVIDASDYGILRMIVNRPELAFDILRNHNYSVHISDVVCLKLPNVAGALNSALSILSQNNITLNYMYAYSSTEKGIAISVIHSNDNKRLIDVLKRHNLIFMYSSEIS